MSSARGSVRRRCWMRWRGSGSTIRSGSASCWPAGRGSVPAPVISMPPSNGRARPSSSPSRRTTTRVPPMPSTPGARRWSSAAGRPMREESSSELRIMPARPTIRGAKPASGTCWPPPSRGPIGTSGRRKRSHGCSSWHAKRATRSSRLGPATASPPCGWRRATRSPRTSCIGRPSSWPRRSDTRRSSAWRWRIGATSRTSKGGCGRRSSATTAPPTCSRQPRIAVAPRRFVSMRRPCAARSSASTTLPKPTSVTRSRTSARSRIWRGPPTLSTTSGSSLGTGAISTRRCDSSSEGGS